MYEEISGFSTREPNQGSSGAGYAIGELEDGEDQGREHPIYAG